MRQQRLHRTAGQWHEFDESVLQRSPFDQSLSGSAAAAAGSFPAPKIEKNFVTPICGAEA
jgi:hypothetical protein